MAGNLEKGLTEQTPIGKDYKPRGEGQGQRPTKPAEKAGKFTLK